MHPWQETTLQAINRQLNQREAHPMKRGLKSLIRGMDLDLPEPVIAMGRPGLACSELTLRWGDQDDAVVVTAVLDGEVECRFLGDDGTQEIITLCESYQTTDPDVAMDFAEWLSGQVGVPA